MLLDKYEFYDIHNVLVWIRSNTNAAYSAEMLKRIIDILEEKQETNIVGSNIIRKALRTIEKIDSEYFCWVFVDNIYTYGHRIEENTFYYELLSKSLKMLLESIHEKDYDRVCDLADAFHNIPVFIADEGKKFKRFIKTQFDFYNKKYKTDLWKELTRK